MIEDIIRSVLVADLYPNLLLRLCVGFLSLVLSLLSPPSFLLRIRFVRRHRLYPLRTRFSGRTKDVSTMVDDGCASG